VWDDFAHGREGVLMPITPPSWIFGLVHPQYAVDENPTLAKLGEWLMTKPFQMWPYLAIESCGPGMKFNAATVSTIVQCAKPLFYNRFGKKVAENSNIMNVPFIHHGIYTDVFKPAPDDVVSNIRADLQCNKDTVLVGCVATNTGRKRLGLLFAAFVDYQSRYEKNSKLWLHTNRLVHDWNIPELMRDYGFTLNDSVGITLSDPPKPDQWLREFYSACDVTVLPTHGEGFGYPIVESQACGTPCVSGSFACEGELTEHKVPYEFIEADGIHNLIRPHYKPEAFADCIYTASKCFKHPNDSWDWSKKWPKFKEWLLK
jgi:glycosyltransferase involved in cell wall biosynthesis